MFFQNYHSLEGECFWMIDNEKPLERWIIYGCLQVLIQGHACLNRAVNEDIVVVEIFPEEKWSAPSNLVLEEEPDVDAAKDDEAEEGDESEKNHEMKDEVSGGRHKKPTRQCLALKFLFRFRWRKHCSRKWQSKTNNRRDKSWAS